MAFKEGSNNHSQAAFDAQRIAQTADRLGVLPLLRNKPGIREYLRAHAQFEEVRGKLTAAAERIAVNIPTTDVSTIASSELEKRGFSPGIGSTLQRNYERTLPLMEIAEAFAEEGLRVQTVEPAFMQEKLNAALANFAITVADGTVDENAAKAAAAANNDADQRQARLAYGDAYRERVYSHDSAYGKVQKAEQEQAETVAENTRVLHEWYPEYEHIRGTLQQLMRELPQRQERLHQVAITHDDFLRWVRIENVLDVAGKMLQEGIHGKTASPFHITSRLNDVLAPYHLHLEPKPLTARVANADAWGKTKQQRLHEKYGKSTAEWLDIARNHDIDLHADLLGIPEEQWEHPTIRIYVEAMVDTQRLERSLGNVRYQPSRVEGEEASPTQGEEQGTFDINTELLSEASLAQRLSDANALTQVVSLILDEGFRGDSVAPGYISTKIDAGLRRFGLHAVPVEVVKTIGLRLPGLWHDTNPQRDRLRAFHKYATEYDSNAREHWRELRETTITKERHSQITAFAKWLSVDERHLQQPLVQKFLGTVYDAEALLQTFEQGEVVPAPGIKPSVAQRFESCAFLMQAVTAILEEGFQGQQVNPQGLQETVTAALSPYGVVIEEIPEEKKWR